MSNIISKQFSVLVYIQISIIIRLFFIFVLIDFAINVFVLLQLFEKGVL